MTTIYSITADGQERIDTIRPEKVAETIKRLRNRGALQVRVIPTTHLSNTTTVV